MFDGPDRWRRWLLMVLLIGIVGTEAELLLLEHWDGWQQLVPLALMGAAIPVAGWNLLAPNRTVAVVLRALMALFVVAGLIGVWFHYTGNVEFELELSPDSSGWALFGEAMMGATPSLAPGSMIWFGLLGLVAGWRAPDKP